MNSKVINLLMICRKAGKLVMGYDSAKECAEKGKACLIITAEGLSPKTVKETVFCCKKYNIPHLDGVVSMDDIFEKFGKRSGVAAVCDKGFADAVIKASAENKAVLP